MELLAGPAGGRYNPATSVAGRRPISVGWTLLPRLDVTQIDTTLRPWLLRHVCEFWKQRIIDPSGGFFEELDLTGEPVRLRTRTTLVQARLTYVFSHAFWLTGDPDFRGAAAHGYEFLCDRCRAPDGSGFYRAVDGDGRVVDCCRDAYDQAFVLFAMAWFARICHSAGPLDIAKETLCFMQAHLADGRHGGFLEEWLPGRQDLKLPRRQNPHMHLLEATLALFTTSGEVVWLRHSSDLIELMLTRFVDRQTGSLIEFFASDWQPAAGPPGRWREPGHHFEWVWLLLEFMRRSGDRTISDQAARLFEFGTRFGIEREGTVAGAVFDGVDAGGVLLAGTKLFWPQMEFIKACLARYETLGDKNAWPLIVRHLELILTSFLRPDGATWYNQLARDGTPMSVTTPARVLYHLFLAFAELDRVRPSNGARC